jgi:hypothetical protein
VDGLIVMSEYLVRYYSGGPQQQQNPQPPPPPTYTDPGPQSGYMDDESIPF